MSCEQMFAWLSQYKKILAAMSKIHHHFYLHRMVKRRNTYISHCYKVGLYETMYKMFVCYNVTIAEQIILMYYSGN